MLGQHERRGLLPRGLEVPEQLGQVRPDPGARHLVVAEPEDRARTALDGQARPERGHRVAHGRRVPRVGELDRQELFERGPAVGERVELVARDEEHAAALLGDELGQVGHLGLRQVARVGVADDHHVVLEEVVLRGREGRQRVEVLVRILGVGRQQDDLQLDRLLALEEVLEVAELVPRLVVDEEDLELLLADVDGPLEPVVGRVELAVLQVDLDDVSDLAGLLRPVRDLDPLRLAVGRGLHGDRFEQSLGVRIGR